MRPVMALKEVAIVRDACLWRHLEDVEVSAERERSILPSSFLAIPPADQRAGHVPAQVAVVRETRGEGLSQPGTHDNEIVAC